MTADKIERLENQLFEQQILLWRMEATLWGIAKNIEESISIKNEVIRQTEKHKTTDTKIIDLEKESKELNKAINWINLKIAMASWVWAAIMVFISKL